MSKNWKNKILDYQPEPPKGVWESIAQKMDEEDEKGSATAFVEKLKSFEVMPPYSAWAAIENELNTEEQALVRAMPVKRKKSKVMYWRMGAAAAIVLIIGSVIWSNQAKNDSLQQPILANNITPVNTAIKPIQKPGPGTEISKNRNRTKDIITLPHKRVMQIEQSSIDQINMADNFVTNASIESLTKDPFENNNEKLANNNGSYAINTDLINSPDRYVIVAGPDGSSRRVSFKLSAYLGYLNNKTPDSEEAIDVIIRESAIWKSKLKNWSDKMINSPLSPTLSNFMDVIELSNFLSEKK